MVFVTDPWRGDFFVKKATGSADGILVFEAEDGNYWHRIYDPSAGILVDWAGADPTGVNNSGRPSPRRSLPVIISAAGRALPTWLPGWIPF